MTNVNGLKVALEDQKSWTCALKGGVCPRKLEAWFDSSQRPAEEIMNRGWTYADFQPVGISEHTDWMNAAAHDRSWRFNLHSWKFMDPVVREYLRTNNAAYLRWCAEVANSWVRQMVGAPGETMAWYDMALAQRSPRLVGLIHLLIDYGGFGEHLNALFRLSLVHQEAHEAEESFNPKNNHGFFAALGQIFLGKSLIPIPGMRKLVLQGEWRMRTMVRHQFLPDGGHSEHSPYYHLVLLKEFEKAIKYEIITDPEVLKIVNRAAYVLGWFVQPDGSMLQFGDSPAKNLVGRNLHSNNPMTQFILSDGLHGEPNPSELSVFRDTGYAIVRSPQPSSVGELKSSSYLAFMGAFHSRAHKHCDDLSIVWMHRGEEILVDAGRYGYGKQLPSDSPLRAEGFYYESAERQFVESSAAHNVVVVDDENHDRRRPPYGSALTTAEQVGNEFRLVGNVSHEGWEHRRTLEFTEGRSLVVTDELVASDEAEHRFTIYFNLSEGLTLRNEAKFTAEFDCTDGSLVQVFWEERSGVELGKALRGPLRGWRSRVDRKLEPAWSHSRTGSFRSAITLRTTFTVS